MSSLLHPQNKQMQKRIISQIAHRVSDLKSCEIRTGAPRTDGTIIYLPFDDEALSFQDLEALSAHEGGHIRFKSLLDPELPSKIWPRCPRLAQYILNLIEDGRIEYLLQLTFPGFWEELDLLNDRYLTRRLQNQILPKKNPEWATPQFLLEFCLFLTSLVSTQKTNWIYRPELNRKGQFLFPHPLFGPYYILLRESFQFLQQQQSFTASVMIAKKICTFLEHVLKEEIKSSWKSPPEPSFKPSSATAIEIPKDPSKGCQDMYSQTRSPTPTIKPDCNPKPDPIENENEDENANESGDSSSLSLSMQDVTKAFLNQLDTGNHCQAPHRNRLSGIKPHESDHDPLKSLHEILTKMDHTEDSLASYDTYATKFTEQLDPQRIKIQKIIQQITQSSTYPLTIPEKETTIKVIPFGHLKFTIVQNLADLQKINGISRGKIIYTRIKHQYFQLIYQISQKFYPIRYSPHLKRGQRRGYVSGRDLSQVRASRGQFKHAFKQARPDRGANLIIFIDESGSMNGTKIKLARQACIILAEATKNTRIQLAILGFAAKYGVQQVCEKVYKTFTEPLNPAKIGTINIAAAFKENRDGDSFLSGVHRYFSNYFHNTPIIIIISDGVPWHGGTSYTGKTAITATRAAIKKIQLLNIKYFAISIDTAPAPYLKDLYDVDHFVHLQHIHQLPAELLKLVQLIAQSII